MPEPQLCGNSRFSKVDNTARKKNTTNRQQLIFHFQQFFPFFNAVLVVFLFERFHEHWHRRRRFKTMYKHRNIGDERYKHCRSNYTRWATVIAKHREIVSLFDYMCMYPTLISYFIK